MAKAKKSFIEMASTRKAAIKLGILSSKVLDAVDSGSTKKLIAASSSLSYAAERFDGDAEDANYGNN